MKKLKKIEIEFQADLREVKKLVKIRGFSINFNIRSKRDGYCVMIHKKMAKFGFLRKKSMNFRDDWKLMNFEIGYPNGIEGNC